MLLRNTLIYLIIISLVTLTKADFTVSDSMPSCKGFTISNSGSENKFGYAVDGGGDFNGDGIPDIVIAGYNDPNPTSVWVIYGRDDGYSDIDVATMSSTDGFKISGFGIANIDNSNYITLAGDIDDDGKADLIIGAVRQDSNNGACYVIYGGTGYTDFDIASPPSTVVKISGPGGWNVNTRADIDGDGINDLVSTSSAAYSTFGAVFVIFGSSTRLTLFKQHVPEMVMKIILLVKWIMRTLISDEKSKKGLE